MTKIIDFIKSKFKKERIVLDLSSDEKKLAVELIRDTDGFKVIMEDLSETSDMVRDVGLLSAHYGNKRINEQIGTLGGGGLIASDVLNQLIDKYEGDKEN